jgi:hypothetical protein
MANTPAFIALRHFSDPPWSLTPAPALDSAQARGGFPGWGKFVALFPLLHLFTFSSSALLFSRLTVSW